MSGLERDRSVFMRKIGIFLVQCTVYTLHIKHVFNAAVAIKGSVIFSLFFC